MDGDDVVQAYIKYPDLPRMPVKELKGFKRITIAKGETKQAEIKIPVSDIQKWDLKTHQFKIYDGNYQIIIGNNAKNETLMANFVFSKKTKISTFHFMPILIYQLLLSDINPKNI